jgi:hypothetical protein
LLLDQALLVVMSVLLLVLAAFLMVGLFRFPVETMAMLLLTLLARANFVCHRDQLFLFSLLMPALLVPSGSVLEAACLRLALM